MAVYRFSKSRQGNNLVSDHFRVSEFACHDGSDEVLIDVDLVFKLEVLRQKFGRPMVISSGYRTPSWNKKVGGKSALKYPKENATQIQFPFPENFQLLCFHPSFLQADGQ